MRTTILRLWFIASLLLTICFHLVLQMWQILEWPKGSNISLNSQPMVPFPESEEHLTSIEFLDLEQWEIESLEGIASMTATSNDAKKSCRPPKGVSGQCCIGISNKPTASSRENCRGKTLADYQKVRDLALGHIPKHQLGGGCDVCRVMDWCARLNMSIAVFGDSLSRQQMSGLRCELERRRYRVESQIIQPDVKRTTYFEYINVRSSPVSAPIQIKFFHQMHIPDENIIGQLNASIVVMNFGLHWAIGSRRVRNSPGHYNDTLNTLFGSLALHHERFRLLVHRESSAQHFDSDGGEYFLLTNTSANTCVPLRRAEFVGWRERSIHQAATNHGFDVVTIGGRAPLPRRRVASEKRKELVVLPFFDFTAELHHMHQLGHDCTHFCSSPFLWWPLWKSLRVAMDREFG